MSAIALVSWLWLSLLSIVSRQHLELAIRYTDEQSYFVLESAVYRLLKAQDFITSSAYILMKAGEKFQQLSSCVNELWQTDFTYFKIVGRG